MKFNLKNFNVNEKIEDMQQRGAAEQGKAKQRKLPEGDYLFRIKTAEETEMEGKWGKYPALVMDLVIDGDVDAPKIRLVTTASAKNQAKVSEFLQSIGVINEAGGCELEDWCDVVGYEGKAHFVPRDLSGGGTVYNATVWHPYDPAEHQDVPFSLDDAVLPEVDEIFADPDDIDDPF